MSGREIAAQQLRQAGHWEDRVIQRRKDGSPVDILAAVSLVQDATGKPVGAVAVNRDITARVQVEEALRRQNQYLSALQETNLELISQLDLDTFPPILGYNQTFHRPDCQVLLAVRETGHPLVALGQFGRGRTLAYTSDPAPHWGCNFVYWPHYPQFWLACLQAVLDPAYSE